MDLKKTVRVNCKNKGFRIEAQSPKDVVAFVNGDFDSSTVEQIAVISKYPQCMIPAEEIPNLFASYETVKDVLSPALKDILGKYAHAQEAEQALAEKKARNK